MHIHSLYLLLTSYALLFNFALSSSHCAYSCDEPNYAPGSTFQSNLQHLLTDLPRNALRNNNSYNNATYGKAPNQVYGLAMCYADASLSACNICLPGASSCIVGCIGLSKEGVAWFDECMIRYSDVAFNASNNNIVSYISEPKGDKIVREKLADPEIFIGTLRQVISNLATNASTSPLNLAVGTTNFTTSRKVYIYTLVQCTRQLPADECRRCVTDLTDFEVDNIRRVSSIARDVALKAVSCYVRYAFDPFYGISEANAAWPNAGKRSREPISIHIFTIIVGALLLLEADLAGI